MPAPAEQLSRAQRPPSDSGRGRSVLLQAQVKQGRGQICPPMNDRSHRRSEIGSPRHAANVNMQCVLARGLPTQPNVAGTFAIARAQRTRTFRHVRSSEQRRGVLRKTAIRDAAAVVDKRVCEPGGQICPLPGVAVAA